MAHTVLAVLSGTPADVAAAAINTPVEQLAEAAELYQEAGLQALQTRNGHNGWYHVYVEFADWDAAEQAAASTLGPRLDQLRAHDMIDAWWFVRKHPCWRLRVRPHDGVVFDAAKLAADTVLDDLLTSGVIVRWWPAIYEPETAAFGGPLGMELVHDLFHLDSRRILEYLRRPPTGVGRKELSMLLCSILLSAAGLDRFERGDVWNRVAELRPLPADVPPGRVDALADRIRPLVCSPLGTVTPSGPCAFAESWAIEFRLTGRALREVATAGHLNRGIRHVLTHVVIFHWNRLGLSATTQGVLSRAARQALLPSGE